MVLNNVAMNCSKIDLFFIKKIANVDEDFFDNFTKKNIILFNL